MSLRVRITALLIVGIVALPVLPAGATPAPAAPVDIVAGELLVKWAPAASANARAVERARHGLEATGRPVVAGYEQVRVDAQQDPRVVAAALARRGAVAQAQPNFIYQRQADATNDPDWSRLWGLKNTNDVDLDVPEAWATTRGSSSVVVAVIDTGVQADHPDLAANMWVNPNETANGEDDDGNGKIDDIHGWDFLNNDATVYHGAEDDHGTHIAGTIAATADNGIGLVGVAPEVRLMSLKFIGADGTGSTSKAIEAIAYAKANGARVINASWGHAGRGDTALRDAIRDSDAVFVAAAGNDGTDNDATPFVPASLDAANLVSVAAVTSQGGLAEWSNYGATSVDVGAPGAGIWSTISANSYGYMSGTSMAAPHVAGVAALLASAEPARSPSDLVGVLKAAAAANSLSALDGKTVAGGMPVAVTSLDKLSVPVWPQDAALTFTDVTASGFTVSWPAASDNVAVADYLVTVGDAPAVVVTGTEHVVTGLAEGSTTAVSVRARDDAGDTGPALSASAITTRVTPWWPADADLTVSEVTSSGFAIAWPAASDDVAVTAYDLSIGGAQPVAVDADTTSYVATGLTEASEYTVEVVARDVDGRTSAALTTTVAMLSSSPVWPAGAAINVSSVTTTGFTLAWPAATDDVTVTGYAVMVGTAPAVATTDLTLAVDGLTAGTTYPVSVVAFDSDDEQSPALTSNVTTTSPPASGGGGGGGGSAPAPSEPIVEEPAPAPEPEVEEEPATSEPTVYDGTTARNLDRACPTATPSRWTDVPANSAHAVGIGCATAWKVFLGGSTSTFSPNTQLSRGQLASVLARAIEQATGTALAAGSDQFSDIKASVHEPAIDKLAGLGIVGGVDATTYAPAAPVTRAQFAAMLGRTYRHLVGSLPAASDAFSDDDGNTHEAAINALAALGIVTGDGAGTYTPGGVLTRAQSASMVSRLIDGLVEAGAIAP